MSGKPPPLHVRRVFIACAVLAALLLCPLPASGGPAWDAGAIAGYVAVVFAVLLYLYPLRGPDLSGQSLPHRRLLTVSQHRRFGWIALALGALHTAIVLAVQPLTVQYLRPSAPLYMLSGIAALLLLAILVPTGLSTRAAMRRTGAPGTTARGAGGEGTSGRARAAVWHSLLACVFLGLLGAHLIGSGQFIDTPAKQVAACVLLALPLLWSVLRARADGTRHSHGAGRSALPVAAVLLLLPLPSSTALLLEPATARTEPLPIRFPHELHTAVSCVTCHHNFRDGTGTANCIDCHRSARSDLTRSSESTFHVFCRDCHRELALEGKRHGPTRGCQPCHAG